MAAAARVRGRAALWGLRRDHGARGKRLLRDAVAGEGQGTRELMGKLMEREGDGEGRLKIFSGSANPELTEEMAGVLGVKTGEVTIKEFADGEKYVRVEESVRGCDCFLVQPTCPPTNENIVELCLMVDACKRASARSITAVVPYFGYGRADRKVSGRESIAAKLVANMLTRSGVDRVLALDLHSGQLEGYFDIPLDKVYGSVRLTEHLSSQIPIQDAVVVSPDVGGVARARAFAKQLGGADTPLAIVDRRRGSPSKAEVTNLIGEVEGRCAVIVDDLIDTGSTLVSAGRVLAEHGARDVRAAATHAVFSEDAPMKLANSPLSEVVTTNSIVVPEERRFPQLSVLSVGHLLGSAILRMYGSESLSSFRVGL